MLNEEEFANMTVPAVFFETVFTQTKLRPFLKSKHFYIRNKRHFPIKCVDQVRSGQAFYFSSCLRSLHRGLHLILSESRSLVALCIAHCSQFEHSGDSTMQSYNV